MQPLSPDALWTALAVGALEPGDALALLREAGPGGPMRLATRRHLLGLSDAPAPVSRVWAGPAALMGGAGSWGPATPRTTLPRVGAGERLRLRVRPPAPAPEIRPLVLHTADGAVQRLLPGATGRWPTLDRFALGPDGERLIDVVLGSPPGKRTVVVALLAASETERGWPEGAAADLATWDAVRNGTLSGGIVDVMVG